VRGNQRYGPLCLTRRYVAVDGDGVEVSFPGYSAKEIQIHTEGDTEVLRILGNTAFTGSADVHLTSDGHTQILSVCVPPGDTICTVKAPSGAAKTLSGAAVDLTGSVSVPCASHGFVEGDVVQIDGTDSYDGAYALPSQTAGDAGHFVIVADFTAETFGGTETARLLSDGVLNVSVLAWG
jgi:hypothetical protein